MKPSDDGATRRVEQMLIDSDAHNYWVVDLDIDLAASREANRPPVGLVPVGSLA